EAGAAEILRGFLHCGVDVGERGEGVEVDDGIERKRLDDRDAPKLIRREPIDGRRGREQAGVVEEGVERAVLPEDLLDADGADERRQNHRDEDERTEEIFRGEKEAGKAEL